MTTTPLSVIREPDQAAVLMDPLRRHILRLLAQPQSAAALGRQLELPRQKVNYHLRELEGAGLVELVEERKRGNCIERVVRATARSYLISPEVLGELGSDPDAVRDRFSAAYLIAAAGRAIRELAALRARADAEQKRLATLTLETDVRFASPAARKAFTEELASLVAEITAKYHDEEAQDGRAFRLLVGAYPAANSAA